MVELAERYADGLESYDNLRSARRTLVSQRRPNGIAGSTANEATPSQRKTSQKQDSKNMVMYTLREGTLLVGKGATHFARLLIQQLVEADLKNTRSNRRSPAPTIAASHEGKAQAVIFREIFGNPFHLIPLDPSWLTSTVIALAKQMYDSRDFSLMPILADALQDAGCDNEDILN